MEDCGFLTYDGVDKQFVAALEKETGETRWLTKRTYKSGQEPPKSKPNDNRKSYATPNIIEYDGKKQLISPAAEATYSYDPATGQRAVVYSSWGRLRVQRDMPPHF